MSCDHNFPHYSKISYFDGETEYTINEWSDLQESCFQSFADYYDIRKAYYDSYNTENLSSIGSAIRMLEEQCYQIPMALKDILAFELYVIAEYPKTYFQWLFRSGEDVLKDILRNPERYLFKDDDGYIITKGYDDYEYLIQHFKNLQEQFSCPKNPRKRRNSIRLHNACKMRRI